MHIVYGGAFNPPTIAHLNVYIYLKEKLPITRFTYLPVSHAYTKTELISNHHRLQMLKLMTSEYNDIEISDLEMTDDQFKGTYQSLVRLSDNSSEEVAFVIGADNIESLSQWIMARSLISEFKIIVLARDNIDVEALIKNDAMLKDYRDQFLIFNDFDQAVSSTEFRKTHDQSMVHEAVYEYIKSHQLYER